MPFIRKFAKFTVVGCSGFIIHMGVLYGLTELGHLWYIVSATIALLIAATNNYLINHYWTFREQREFNPSLLKGWMRYLTTVALAEVIYLAILAVLTETLELWYMGSAAVAIALTSLLRFFFLSKWHRDNVSKLPEDKVFITSNGI